MPARAPSTYGHRLSENPVRGWSGLHAGGHERPNLYVGLWCSGDDLSRKDRASLLDQPLQAAIGQERPVATDRYRVPTSHGFTKSAGSTDVAFR